MTFQKGHLIGTGVVWIISFFFFKTAAVWKKIYICTLKKILLV